MAFKLWSNLPPKIARISVILYLVCYLDDLHYYLFNLYPLPL